MKRTIILLSVLVLLIVIVLGGVYYYRSNTGDRLLSRANLALRANKPDKAHELAAKYIRSHPDDWQGYYLQSRAYGTQTRFAEAHASLDLAAGAGAGADLVAIFRADLLTGEGQTNLTSEEAPDLLNAADKLNEALAVLAALSPTEESVVVDVAFRAGMAQRSAAAANGKLAIVLQRKSLRVRANRSAPALMPKWRDVFSSMDDADRTRLMEILAETLSFEGYVQAEVEIIQRAGEILSVLLAAPTDDEPFRQQALVVAGAVALVQADLEAKASGSSSRPWLDKADQYCRTALVAKPNDWQAMHLHSQVAFRRADAAMTAARQAMLDVIAKDPSRSEAAIMAVRLCLNSDDREGLAAARASLEPLADAPTAASLMLIRHQLRLAGEQHAPGDAGRKLIAVMAGPLDEIAAKHPGDGEVVALQADVAVRLGRYEQATSLIAEAKRIDPRGPGAGFARLLEAQIGMATEGAKAVEAELTQLRADHPNSPRVQYTYALATAALGQRDLTLDTLRMMTKIGAGRPLVPPVPGVGRELNRAEVALRLSDPATAEAICDALIVKASSPETAFHARGWLLRAWARWQLKPDDPQRLVQFVVQANNTDYADEAAAAVDEIVAMAANALGQAAAEAPGADGPSPRASGLLSVAMKLLPTAYSCRRMLNDALGADEVIQQIVDAPRLSSRHRAAVAGVLAELGRTETAERLLREQLAQHADESPEAVYARLVGLYLAQGNIEKALVELDGMLDAAGASDVAQLRKAQILAAIDRRDEADAIVGGLVTKATAASDETMLQLLTGYYSKTLQAAKTVEMLDALARIRTPTTKDYLVGASALSAVGRYDEAAQMYRRAIGLERDEMKTPAMYRDLALLMDADHRRAEALGVLAELRELPGPDSRKQIYQAESLFHEGSLMLRWGLYGQAADRFVGLAAGEQEGSSAGRMALGRALAGLAETERASRVLSTIKPGDPQYLSAQLLRISLAPENEDRIKLFGRLARIAPTNEGVLVELMLQLREAGRAGEAIDLYRAFVARQGLAYRPKLPSARGASESRAPMLALYMQWESGRRAEAAAEADRVATLTGAVIWRLRAALLTATLDPPKAVGLLETTWADAATQVEADSPINAMIALAGVSVATLAGDADAATTWTQRADAAAANTTPSNRFLAALAVGDGSVDARCADVLKAGGLTKAPAEELMATASSDSAATGDEAAKLLVSSLADLMGMPWLARSISRELLEARPQNQWAAVLLHTYRQSEADSTFIIDVLVPTQCAIGQAVQADLLAAEGDLAGAAALYKTVADETGESTARMQYAMALEQTDRGDEAIAEYLAIWQADQDPVAANNAAYRMQVVYSGDTAKLAEAHRLASEAVRLSGGQAAFRDTLGWIAYHRGHHEEAARELVQALRQMPNSPTIHYHVAVAEAAAGNRQLSRWHLETAGLLVDRHRQAGRPVGPEDQEAARLAGEMLARMKGEQ